MLFLLPRETTRQYKEAAMPKRKSKSTAAPCCESDATERKAAGVDVDIKASNLRRLRRIEGQVRGLQKMVEDDRYCVDILVQLAAAQEGLRAVGRELIRNHMKHCVHDAMQAGPEQADAVIDELVAVLHKHSK